MLGIFEFWRRRRRKIDVLNLDFFFQFGDFYFGEEEDEFELEFLVLTFFVC